MPVEFNNTENTASECTNFQTEIEKISVDRLNLSPWSSENFVPALQKRGKQYQDNDTLTETGSNRVT